MDEQLLEFEEELKSILIGYNNYKDINFNTNIIFEINAITYGLEIIFENGNKEHKPLPRDYKLYKDLIYKYKNKLAKKKNFYIFLNKNKTYLWISFFLIILLIIFYKLPEVFKQIVEIIKLFK